MADVERELALRSHIRNLLLDYALTHLTTNYITFTENAVEQLTSECLVPIPTTDPTSLKLPTEPFEDLSNLLNLSNLKPHDEKLAVEHETQQYLKRAFTLPSTPRSEICWEKDISDKFEEEYAYFRFMSPILTARAIRETPKPGSSEVLKAVPSSLPALLDSFSIIPTEPEMTPDPPKISLEDALKLRHILDPVVINLIKSSPFLGRTDPKHTNPHVDSFLRRDSPAYDLPRLDSPPLFPRTRKHLPGPGNASIIHSLSDLPKVLTKVEVEENEEELYKQNMIIVDGWQTYVSSPSPPSTPDSTGSNEIDELWQLSSPGTEDIPPIKALMDAKMDEIILPKSRRIGGSTEQTKRIGEDESLAAFLTPLIRILPEPSLPAVLPSSPQPALSMLGQASEPGTDLQPDDDDLDAAFSKICAATKYRDPRDLIMKDKLPEKDQILMDVPSMSAPNEHPKSAMYLPTAMADLVGQDMGVKKKALGVKALNMELSWIPFNFGTRKPTTEDAAAVSSIDFPEDTLFKNLIEQVTYFDAEPTISDLVWTTVDDKSYGSGREFEDGATLSRGDRRRLAGLPEDLTEDEDDSDKEITTHEDIPRLAKRMRVQQDVDDSGISFMPSGALSPNDVDVDTDKENIPFEDFNLGFENGLRPSGTNSEAVAPSHDEFVYPHSSGYFPSDPYYQTGDQIAETPDGADPVGFLPLSYDSNHGNLTRSSLTQEVDMDKDLCGGAECYGGFDQGNNDQDNSCSFSRLPYDVEQDTINVDGGNLGAAIDSASDLDTGNTKDAPTSYHELPRSSLTGFASLRAKHLTETQPPPTQPQNIDLAKQPLPSAPQTVPEEIIDRNTIRFPSNLPLPSTLHCYMASMELVQKQELLRSLRLPQCAVELVERISLEVDLIIDPHTAIIFAPLLSLPSECGSLCSRLGRQSWRFSRILVVFEAYPSSCSYKRKSSDTSILYAFTPPVLKAVKKLRRDLGIAEAYETKSMKSNIQFAFANSVLEAAVFARTFGDEAEARDETGGVIWGDRGWLDGEEREDEYDLANVDGMNNLAAFVILCQISLQDFLDASEDTRLEQFGPLVGMDRMTLFNEVIASRYQTMDSLMSSDVAAELEE